MLNVDFLSFSDRMSIMNSFTAIEAVQAQIGDEEGTFVMDESIGPCDGTVTTVSTEGVIAEVFPSYNVCKLCALFCDARLK